MYSGLQVLIGVQMYCSRHSRPKDSLIHWGFPKWLGLIYTGSAACYVDQTTTTALPSSLQRMSSLCPNKGVKCCLQCSPTWMSICWCVSTIISSFLSSNLSWGWCDIVCFHPSWCKYWTTHRHTHCRTPQGTIEHESVLPVSGQGIGTRCVHRHADSKSL